MNAHLGIVICTYRLLNAAAVVAIEVRDMNAHLDKAIALTVCWMQQQQQQQARIRDINAHLDNAIALTGCWIQQQQQVKIRDMNA